MSPSAALESDVFCWYAAIVVALLLAGGVTLAALRWGARRNVDHAWTAYRSWLLMAPLVLGVVFLGREATIVGYLLLAVFGVKEFARATGLYRDWLMTGTVYVGILAVAVVALVPDPSSGATGWYGFFMALPVYVIAAILLMPIIRNRVEGQLQACALAAVAFIYMGWMFGHIAFLANAEHAYGYVLFLLFAVEVNDVAAYVFGRLFGRHPLRNNISPAKTWEGALGAMAVAMVLPWALAFSFPHFTWLEGVLTGLIVGVAGQLGALSMSVIKRDLGIKDMGSLIAGHGGILDRIDSLIYTTPLFFHMVRYFAEV